MLFSKFYTVIALLATGALAAPAAAPLDPGWCALIKACGRSTMNDQAKREPQSLDN